VLKSMGNNSNLAEEGRSIIPDSGSGFGALDWSKNKSLWTRGGAGVHGEALMALKAVAW